MPKCYLVLASRSPSMDEHVSELVALEFPIKPGFLVHGHWLFAPKELKVEFEIRPVLRDPRGKETALKPVLLKPATRTQKTLMNLGAALAIDAPGDYELSLEWRRGSNTAWTRSAATWPIMVMGATLAPDPAAN